MTEAPAEGQDPENPPAIAPRSNFSLSESVAIVLIPLLIFISTTAYAATNFSPKNSSPTSSEFQELVQPSQEIPLGEHLVYDVSWMGVPVGKGELWVKEKTDFNGKEAYHIVAFAATNDFLSRIYPVRDEVHSWVDARTLQSLGSRKKASEGFYRADERVTYDEAAKKGHYESMRSGEKKEFDISVPVHDPVSAFYWVRRQTLKPGHSLKSTVNNGEKDYSLEVDVLSRETKEMRGGGVEDTVLVEPKSRLKGILEKRGRVWVRLRNDARRTPLLVTFRTPFGPIVGSLKTTRPASSGPRRNSASQV